MVKGNARISAIIVGAGRGVRFGGDIPKQYCLIGNECIFAKTIKSFLNHSKISDVTAVIAYEDKALFSKLCSHLNNVHIVFGEDNRQGSVRNGLNALCDKKPDFVLIHDAARPFVSSSLIDDLIENVEKKDAVIPILRIRDTLKTIDEINVGNTVDRNAFACAQTPQAFNFSLIMEAHNTFAKSIKTDDASLVEELGKRVSIIEGKDDLFKITRREDLRRARLIADCSFQTRIGLGYDVHRFCQGDHIVLCGIEIPYTKGLLGHSDADVGLHALTDAVLGAIAMGDIGEHFPPTDDRWRGQSSDKFVSFAMDALRLKNGDLINVDLTIICEAPKILKFKSSMSLNLSRLLKLPNSRINIKATTTEGLGSIGRSEGIAAQAVVSVKIPYDH